MGKEGDFNPYYRWLGIPEDVTHPDHYKLLGITVFEENAEVISNAADRQMTILRTYQAGPYSALSQRILNEVSAARVCLLNPEKKQAYDNRLRLEILTQLEKVFTTQETEIAAENATSPPKPKVRKNGTLDLEDEDLEISQDAPRVVSQPAPKRSVASKTSLPVFNVNTGSSKASGKTSSKSMRRPRPKKSNATPWVILGALILLGVLAVLLLR